MKSASTYTNQRQIFVSSCAVELPPAVELISHLKEAGFQVTTSPAGPLDNRWPDWYASGCREEISRMDIFIAVLTEAWDSSTWMAHESDTALQLLASGKLSKMYFWNPESLEVKASGMSPYLRERLPDDFDQLLPTLEKS